MESSEGGDVDDDDEGGGSAENALMETLRNEIMQVYSENNPDQLEKIKQILDKRDRDGKGSSYKNLSVIQDRDKRTTLKHLMFLIPHLGTASFRRRQ